MITKISATATTFLVAILLLSGCRGRGLPQPGSAEYRELVRAFNVGLAGLQSGEDVRAMRGLTRAAAIAPGEPASFANLGILALRQQEFETARQRMEEARSLAPENSRIEHFLGDIESRRGNLAEAIRHLNRAVELDGSNYKALYALAEQTERQGTSSSDAEALGILKRLLQAQPANTAVLLDTIRLAARTSDTATVKAAVERLRHSSAGWSDDAHQRLQALAQSAQTDLRQAAIQSAFLRNLLQREPGYRHHAEQVKTPAVFAGDPFVRFLRLPSPSIDPASPDTETAFTQQPLTHIAAGAEWLQVVYLDDTGKPSVLSADGKAMHLDGAPAALTPVSSTHPSSVAAADLDYDFRNDLVIASTSGLRIYRQEQPRRFVDRTAQAGLPRAVISGSYTGAWAFDVDLDGDLDILLGVAGSAPVVLRNNADNTFALVRPFSSGGGLTAFAAADIDGDGDPDPALLDARGDLHVWTNERLGRYRQRSIPPAVATGVSNVAVADMDVDGQVDILVLKRDGGIIRLSDQNNGGAWQTAELAKGQPAGRTLAIADFDNNGALDILAGSRVFLRNEEGFSALRSTVNVDSASVSDMNGDGRVDIVGLSSGAPVLLVNRGAKNYRWQVIRTRAANAQGDQRINPFGLGGEVDVRAGLLAQKQTITSPVLHFGLGEHPQSDLARIIWPNGLIQVEFELKANQSILAAQRLKGSCPSLFAWDGSRIAFVKDGAPWSPALGLHINAQKVAGIYQTEEWFKIPGNHLAPRDGYYDLRVTAELWETFYIDHYSLLAVDHPAGTEIFVDERFAIPPPPLKIYTTSVPRAFAHAVDDTGGNVAGLVGKLDRVYLDTFGRGQYQGVTRDHWVELELPPDAPKTAPLYLIADGWMHPTDATVNVALGQSSNPPPQGLRIEVPNASGQWTTVRSNLGFPAGKLKTVALDVSGIFKPGAPRKLRLGTNMEIYWDRLAWAQGTPEAQIQTARLPLTSAELRYRGFSVMQAANASSPELPDYNKLEATGQKWRDLEGYYTRYGDIRPLLENIDDRMVIANAGDEMRFKFKAPAPVREGWRRDFIMVGDGWIKDGDYNSVFSKTVLPLPYHGLKDYTAAPGSLEDEVAFKKHPLDWQRFHTRYIAPDFFRRSLWHRQ